MRLWAPAGDVVQDITTHTQNLIMSLSLYILYIYIQAGLGDIYIYNLKKNKLLYIQIYIVYIN